MQSPQIENKPSNLTPQEYSTRIFIFALELIPAFGIPAIIGVFLNKLVLESYPGAGTAATATIFFLMYTCSWIFVIMRYRSIKQKHQK